MTEGDDKILAHLNAFSMAAMETLAAARSKTGQRGANAIDVGDLLFGIVLHDQGMMGNMLSTMHGSKAKESLRVLSSPSHRSFFPPATAGDILARIENLLPQSEPYTHTREVPLSPDLERTFDEAKDVRDTVYHKQIEPMHLLAAILSQESSQYVKLLRGSGITREMVIERLRSTED